MKKGKENKKGQRGHRYEHDQRVVHEGARFISFGNLLCRTRLARFISELVAASTNVTASAARNLELSLADLKYLSSRRAVSRWANSEAAVRYLCHCVPYLNFVPQFSHPSVFSIRHPPLISPLIPYPFYLARRRKKGVIDVRNFHISQRDERTNSSRPNVALLLSAPCHSYALSPAFTVIMNALPPS